MACANCKDVVDLNLPEMELKYKATAFRILGSDGNYYQIKTPLIPTGKRPRGGWGVTIRINRQAMLINGMSAKEVAGKIRKLATLNGVQVSELDLWFNLNILWLTRCIEKYQKVFLSDLLLLSHEPEK